ncbi:hypothetical protein DXG01_006406 [Tephrocybe rancida]|nr:hypothetical protein DXG01_006406 [Tephrocybe rancida]
MGVPNIFRASAWALPPGKSAYGPSGHWSNEDMDPVPPKQRTWSTWNFIAYWISDATHAAMWQFASSMLAVGLTCTHDEAPTSRRQALAAIAVGHFIIAMLKAIWPATARIPNHLSASSPVTTRGMMSYFLFWIIQLPLLLVHPQKIKHFFTAKSIIVPCAWLAILIWAMVRVPSSISLAPDRGPLSPTTLSGSQQAWAWLNALNSSLGLYATLSINIPDFTRYAKNERAQFVQLIIIPAAFTLVGFVGIAVTAAAEYIYGEILWDPLRLIDKWDNRAAAFFASFSFLLSIIGSNVSANSISAANDLMVLCPKYINIRRGQVICALIGGWALCPWEILATAPGFLSFMSGYTVFLGPFAGIMVADYWLVHKGNVDVPAMYHPHGRYRYWNGINWRAAVTLLCSVIPTLPGLIGNINPKIKVGGALHLFDIAWLYGFFSALLIFWGLSTMWPAPETFMDQAVLAEHFDDDEPYTESASRDEKEKEDSLNVKEKLSI